MKFLFVTGTRPEVIKMMPVMKEFKKKAMPFYYLHTGQHTDIAEPIFDIFGIRPDINLSIMKEKQSLDDITSAVLAGAGKIIDKDKYDAVIVHGDTTTSVSAALAAFYRKIPVAHVEAGLRSGNLYSPWPEEMNRIITDKITSFHFAPTENNKENLLKESISEKSIHVTGNTVIDAVKYIAGKEKKEKKNQVLITAHRRENFGIRMEHMFNAIKFLAEKYSGYNFIIPVHPNPNVRNEVNKILSGIDNIELKEPMSYPDFIKTMSESFLIMTDSGGIQEEAPFFNIPVIVMREETERNEGVKAGTLILAGTESENIIESAEKLFNDSNFYSKVANSVNPYGDGKASERIAFALEEIFR